MKRRGLILIVSSPSGAGKTTVIKNLIKKIEGVSLAVTATSRAMRPGEVDGKDYFFFSKEDFQNKIKEGFFWEHVEYCGNFYGVPKASTLAEVEKGNDVILVIESEGMRAVKATNPEDVVTVFIMIRSFVELEARLRSRGDPREVVEKRIGNANNEIVNYDQYDYFIFNDEVEKSSEEIKAIISAERLKLTRQVEVPSFIDKEFLSKVK